MTAPAIVGADGNGTRTNRGCEWLRERGRDETGVQTHNRSNTCRATSDDALIRGVEVQCADGKAPTVQTWCPRNIQTVEEATAQCPCTFKEGQRLVVGFDSMEPNNFDAKNGVIIRAVSVLPLE